MNKDSLNPITVGEFRNLLIGSEILVTAIVMLGFFLIFRSFVKKQKKFESDEK